MRAYLWQFLLLGGVASLVGCLLGYAGHWALHAWLAQLLASPLPSPSLCRQCREWRSVCCCSSVSPCRRCCSCGACRPCASCAANWGRRAAALLGGYALGLAALAAVMVWVAGDVVLGGWVVGGFVAALAFFALLARLAVRLAAGLRGGAHAAAGFGWRYGLANLERHALGSVVQIVALALGLMALLLLTATRGDLLDAWRRAIPPDAPNRFVINIQPEQVVAVGQRLSAAGIESEIVPMVRGRMTELNGRTVGVADYEDDRAKRLIDREFNLSWRADLPYGNSVVQGHWFAPAALTQGVASVEEGLAKTLGIRMGTR